MVVVQTKQQWSAEKLGRVTVTKPRGPGASQKEREEANGVKQLRDKRTEKERYGG